MLRFQDIVKITDFLARHLHRHGDELLMKAKPVALSVNEMFSITKRLKLPFDASGVGEICHVILEILGFALHTFSKQVGGRTGQPTILNTLTIAGVCSEIIGWPKLFVLLVSKWGEGQASQPS